MALKASDREI